MPNIMTTMVDYVSSGECVNIIAKKPKFYIKRAIATRFIFDMYM